MPTKPDRLIGLTGTRLRTPEMDTHSRSEAAIRRWDLAGTTIIDRH